MERMASKHRASVKIVIADSDTYTCQGLRNALTNEGYRDVRTVGRVAVLRDVMLAAMVDLLVLDVDLPDGAAIGLVKAIRRGKIGRNPFLPIILLTWASEPKVVQRAVGSGVDLILVKPLSPAQLFSRIDGLIANRKQFVVTADYLGPDRRGHDKPDNVQLYDVPNTLKDKIEGKPVDPAALSEQIHSALQEMNGSRLAQAAVKLAGAVDGLCRAFEAEESDDDLVDEATRTCRMARDIAGLGGADITKLGKSLVKILTKIRNKLEEGDDVDVKQIELLRPLSHSILLAANPKTSLHPVMNEINRALSSFAPAEQPNADTQRTATEAAD